MALPGVDSRAVEAPESLTLREFTPGLAEVVSSWATTAEEVLAWCSRTAAAVPAEVIAGWGREPDVLAYVLLDDGRPVGYGEVWVDDEQREVEIARVLVAPARRGQGFGRALVTHLVAAGRRLHPAVFLRVTPGNDAAVACYRAAGFIRVAPELEQEWNIGQPAPYLWMTHPG
ncbi:MAG TPA: GNAT family N-acetyltransferase [Pseudonocardiaceae bacterium]